MTHIDEYNDTMIQVLELIWGSGYMSPGGEGNVLNLFEGLDLKDKRILDIGCGLGGPACYLAEKFGASVTGIDIEKRLIEHSKAYSLKKGTADKTNFILVEPGSLDFPDEEFDYVFSIGAFTQIEGKSSMYLECLRVLKNGGCFTSYEWLKSIDYISEEMQNFYQLDGLTYAMQTFEEQVFVLKQSGFSKVDQFDCSQWYKKQAHNEIADINYVYKDTLIDLIGEETTDHYIEAWNAMLTVIDNDELVQSYCKAYKLA
ncbi:MAG: methyltransferase domain-containing protein [Flavobacteriales bacterium]|nr:methyltransferase domain-containing protein [Flavobacteriales bacterium]